MVEASRNRNGAHHAAAVDEWHDDGPDRPATHGTSYICVCVFIESLRSYINRAVTQMQINVYRVCASPAAFN